jgi:cysteine desulfurase
MQRVYLDNASTTKIDQEVCEAMLKHITSNYGNPSSLDKYGREAKVAIEQGRKKIADILSVSPSEIFFVSSGTEGNNMSLYCSIHTFNIKHIITSHLEHYSVLNTINFLSQKFNVKVSYVDLDESGHINYKSLDNLLMKSKHKALVSLMNANNEIGNITDIKQVGDICKHHDAIFHCDMVQTIGHYEQNLQSLNVHMATASAHKFHGPKGIGFIYINGRFSIVPFIYGGGQERNMRAGTENVYGIVGMGKALEITHRDRQKNRSKILNLKKLLIDKLMASVTGLKFNGDSQNLTNSLYSIVNVKFPKFSGDDMLVYNMDIGGVSVSQGSACNSGSNVKSHVIQHLNGNDDTGTSLRISLSKYNTPEEIDYTCELMKDILQRGIA